MGQFRLELNAGGQINVDIRVAQQHHRVTIEPWVDVAVAMESLEEEFGLQLGYELTDGERDLILRACALLENVRNETKAHIERTASIKARAQEKFAARQPKPEPAPEPAPEPTPEPAPEPDGK